AQAEGNADAIKVVVGKRQALGVCLYILDVGGAAPVDQAVAADLEHGFVDVRQHHFALCAHQLGKLHGEVARAAGDIQHPMPFTDTAHLDGEAFPDPVDAHRHQVVHEVVFAGDGMKDVRHTLYFFLHRHLFVPEICGVLVVVHANPRCLAGNDAVPPDEGRRIRYGAYFNHQPGGLTITVGFNHHPRVWRPAPGLAG